MLSSNTAGGGVETLLEFFFVRQILRLKRELQERRKRCAGLTVLKSRGTFLDERGHAFLLIHGRKQGVKQAPFEKNSFRQRKLVRSINGFLGHQDRR